MMYRDHGPLTRITIAKYTLRRVQRELDEAVAEALACGHSWATIAQNAGVTRYAAQQRWGSMTKEKQ